MTDQTYDFADLVELRDWLNRFNDTELTAMYILAADGGDALVRFTVKDKTLTDGSTVSDVEVSLAT